MRHIVHKLRQRPDHHKRIIAIGVSCAVTAMVFGIWYSTQTFSSGPEIIAAAKPASPIEVFSEGVASSWNGLTSIFR